MYVRVSMRARAWVCVYVRARAGNVEELVELILRAGKFRTVSPINIALVSK